MKLHVSPPDINKSNYFFKVLSNKHLMYGLGAIKGMGEAAIENIMASRTTDGEFTGLFDFCRRIELRKFNKRTFEVLIKSGCLDFFKIHRASLMASLPVAIQYAEQASRNQLYGQQDLLSLEKNIDSSIQYTEAAAWSEEIQLQGEKETLGFYLTGHPLNQYLNELANFTTCKISELNIDKHSNVRIASIITQVRIRQTKRGDRIAILNLEDGSSQIQAVCFSECFQKYRSLINDDQIIIIAGDVMMDEFSNKPRIVCRDLSTIEMARQQYAKYFQIDWSANINIDWSHINKIFSEHLGGNCFVIIRYMNNNIEAKLKLGKKWQIDPSQILLKKLTNYFPLQAISFLYA